MGLNQRGNKKTGFYPPHPCTVCGETTTMRFLCLGCYNKGEGHVNDRVEITLGDNIHLTKKYRQLKRRVTKETVKHYHLGNMTQEELNELGGLQR